MHFYFLPPILSFIATIILIKTAQWFFPKMGLMDRPHQYGLKRHPIPYSVGIVFYIVVFLAAIFFVKMTPIIVGLLASGGLIVLVSFIDDRKRVSPWIRLIIQIAAAVILVYAGLKIQVISNPFGPTPFFLDTIKIMIAGHEIWLLSLAAVVFWMVLMMNVVNWIDGIPGLASGISTIAQFSLFFLSLKQFHVVDQSAIITLSSVLGASTLAFLFFDFAKPKVLMGDTGSMFLGFMLGALSMIAGGKFATALLIMGFPVLDLFVVIIGRALRGKSPLHWDYSHLHHRLLQAGFTPEKALIFNYIFSLSFAFVALNLDSTFTKFIALAIIMILLAITLWYVTRKKAS